MFVKGFMLATASEHVLADRSFIIPSNSAQCVRGTILEKIGWCIRCAGRVRQDANGFL
jgi:hypothetical protein